MALQQLDTLGGRPLVRQVHQESSPPTAAVAASQTGYAVQGSLIPWDLAVWQQAHICQAVWLRPSLPQQLLLRLA